MRIHALKSISWRGIEAAFSTSRIAFIPGLKLCKDSACKPKEGPTFHLALKLLPPSFKLELSLFVDLLGFKFGASLLIFWKDAIHFHAEFTAYPISLAGGLIAMTKSNFEKGQGGGGGMGPGGPRCVFDSKQMLLRVSGRVQLLGFAKDAFLEVRPTRFKLVRESTYPVLGAFRETLVAGIGGAGNLPGVTMKMEVDNRGPSLIKTIKKKVTGALTAAKEAGERKIKAARANLRAAKRAYVRKLNDMKAASRKLRSWENRLNNACEEEDFNLLQLGDDLHPQHRKLWLKQEDLLANIQLDNPDIIDNSNLSSTRKRAETSADIEELLDESVAATGNDLQDPVTMGFKRGNAARAKLPSLYSKIYAKANVRRRPRQTDSDDEFKDVQIGGDAQTFVQTGAKWGGRRRRWHAHVPHRWHAHIPHPHIPHFHTAAMINAARRAAAAAAKRVKDAAIAAARAAAEAARRAAAAAAKVL